MYNKFLFVLAWGIITNSIVFAQTIIQGGNVSGTWTAAGSPYNVQGSITVPADSTLNIQPGVDVIFQGIYSLIVNGSLSAIGTEMDSISFYASDTSNGWGGIRLGAGADNSWISYASIRYGRNTDGGGIYCASPNAVITHCAITDNKADNNGGGICINTGITNPPPVINHCFISRNSARFGGGLFYVADSMVISDCIISHNSAQRPSGEANGGGIYFDGGLSSGIYVHNCTIQNNFCESDSTVRTNANYGLGGGINIDGRNNAGIFISNCQILSNWSRRSGGGIFLYMGGMVLTDCTLRGNFTKPCAPYDGQYLEGGGAISFANSLNNSIISRCEISENFNLGFAPTGGGAIRAFYNVNASLTLENCTISRNYSNIGWGAIHFDNTLILKNSIVAFNQSGNQSGGIVASNTTVSFCNFLKNDGPDITGASGDFGVLIDINANGDSCDVYSNIFLNPLFADTLNSNYQIGWANWPDDDATRSPAIDAGDHTSAEDPDGTQADMGAWYFNQMRPLVSASDSLLDFGIVDVGQMLNLPFLIRNNGTAALNIQNISNNQDVFSHNWSPSESLVPAGDSLEVIVTFIPADSNLILDTLVIENDNQLHSIELSGQGHVVTSITDQTVLPKKYALYPAYPNPFNPTTTIEFDLPGQSYVTLKVYSVLGEEVSTLIIKQMDPGRYKYIWNAANLASGIYFYRINANEFNMVKKIILLR